MNCTEITNLTDTELELLFAQKELASMTPEVEEIDWLNEDFGSFEGFDFDTEISEEQKAINALTEKVENLTAKVAAEKAEMIATKIEANNAIIEQLRTQIAGLKPTKAGRSFVNFYTGKTQFMTFTAINAAKLNNQITCILNENKELKAA